MYIYLSSNSIFEYSREGRVNNTRSMLLNNLLSHSLAIIVIHEIPTEITQNLQVICHNEVVTVTA